MECTCLCNTREWCRCSKTARLILEPLAIDDASQIQVLFPHWEIVKHLAAVVPWPYPPDGALAYIRDVALPAVARGEEWHWTLRLTDGSRSADRLHRLKHAPNPRAENRGFWSALPWHRRGLMTEAADAVTDYWFDVLKFPRAARAEGGAEHRVAPRLGKTGHAHRRHRRARLCVRSDECGHLGDHRG